jgi:hypothetical protein
MKMHLLNILNSLNVNKREKDLAVAHFANRKVSFYVVGKFVAELRKENIG